MKRAIICIIATVFLLSGCSFQQPEATNQPQETVADIFTTPPTAPEDATAAATESGGEAVPTTPGLPERDLPIRQGLGFVDQEMTYTGGEIHVPLEISTQGYANIGLGIRLFVDGQPQPYKTTFDDTVRYMHAFYQDDMVQTYDLIFTPVTGKAGETVEVHAMSINDPTFFFGDGLNGFRHTHGSLKVSSLLTFEQTPPEQDLPEVEEILMNWSSTTREATDQEVGGWTDEQLEGEIAYRFLVNGDEATGGYFGFSAEDTLKLHYEVWGSPFVNYSFVIYADNQPVSILPENRMDVEIKNGQVTVIDAELSLADFDGSRVINAALVPRNQKLCGVETDIRLLETGTFYISDAASYEDLLAGNQ